MKERQPMTKISLLACAVLLPAALVTLSSPAAARDGETSNAAARSELQRRNAEAIRSWVGGEGHGSANARQTDCRQPLSFAAGGEKGLIQCRPRPVNPFLTTVCHDAKNNEVPSRQRERHCQELDANLKAIANDTTGKALQVAIDRTLSIMATVGQSVVQPMSLQVWTFNAGPEGILFHLLTPQAYGSFQRTNMAGAGPTPETRSVIDAGYERFAYAEDLRIEFGRDAQGPSWTYETILRRETDNPQTREQPDAGFARPHSWIRVSLKGHFDGARVGDLNLAGLSISSYEQKSVEKTERLFR
jgi:hypothetical protein